MEQRDAQRNYLKEMGIPSDVYYPKPLHLQKAFAYLGYKEGEFPVSEALRKHVIALPVSPEMVDEQLKAVVETIADFYRGNC